MNDRILGVFCILLAIFYGWEATQIELGFIVDPLGPKAFPLIVAGLLILSSIYLIARPDPTPQWPGLRRMIEVIFGVAVMAAYTMLLPAAGFVVSTAGAASVLSWRLGAKPVEAVVAGVLIAGGLYATFHLALGLSLARGPLGF